MELTEVVSPQVALPVFGVVLCAVLVFVFGFKSPEQPPSFEFDEDSKRRRGKKSKSPKSQTNGLAVPVVSDDSTTSKLRSSPKSSAARPTPPAKQISPRKATVEAKYDQKTEMQKKSDQLKKVKKAVSKEPVKKEAEDDFNIASEGWTTLISRKEKKLRHKKDDKSDTTAEEKPGTVISEEVEQVTMETEIVTTPVPEQKNKKKNKKKVLKDVIEEESVKKKHSKSKKSKKEKSPEKESSRLDLSANDDFVPPVIPQKMSTSATELADSQPAKAVKSPKKKKKEKVDNLAKAEAKTTAESSIAVANPALPDISDSKHDTPQPNITSSEGVPNIWIEAKPKSKKKKVRRDN